MSLFKSSKRMALFFQIANNIIYINNTHFLQKHWKYKSSCRIQEFFWILPYEIQNKVFFLSGGKKSKK